MKALGWLAAIIGVGVIIEAWQGKNPLDTLGNLFSGQTSVANTITKPKKS
jgi:hypothetical protein